MSQTAVQESWFLKPNERWVRRKVGMRVSLCCCKRYMFIYPYKVFLCPSCLRRTAKIGDSLNKVFFLCQIAELHYHFRTFKIQQRTIVLYLSIWCRGIYSTWYNNVTYPQTPIKLIPCSTDFRRWTVYLECYTSVPGNAAIQGRIRKRKSTKQ